MSGNCAYCPGSEKQSPEYLDHIEVLQRKVYSKKAQYSETWCRCTHCNSFYKVTEDPGYHFPYQTWQKIRQSEIPGG